MNKHGVIACYSFLTNIETLHSAVNGVGSVLFVTSLAMRNGVVGCVLGGLYA